MNSKKIIKGLSICIVLCMIFSLTINVLAQNNIDKTQEIINYGVYAQSYTSIKDEITLPFVKLAADKITLDGDVNNTGFSACQTEININGNATHPQLLLSRKVNINGNIDYALIYAQTVNIYGKVNKDVIIFADTVNIEPNAQIDGDAIINAKTLNTKGKINGNLVGNIQYINLDSNIKGDFRVNTSDVTFGNELIQGNILINSENRIPIPEKYTNAEFNLIEKDYNEKTVAQTVLDIVIEALFTAFLFACLYYIVKAVDNNKFERLTKKVSDNMLYVILVGLISILMLPIEIMLFICFSIIAMPVVLPLFILYIAILIVTMLLATFITGSYIYNIIVDKIIKADNKYKKVLTLLLLFGIYLLIILLCKIKFVGSYIGFANFVFAMGIIITDIFKRNKNSNEIK